MPNTFSKLYIHHVSAVKYRQGLILPKFEDQLYKYIAGIIIGLNQTPIEVNGMPDHIHILARLRPTMAPSEFVQKVKANSSKWINERGFLEHDFAWQRGGGTFSVGERNVDIVRKYIQNQKIHHQKSTFEGEYLEILKDNRLDSKSEYLPDFFDKKVD